MVLNGLGPNPLSRIFPCKMCLVLGASLTTGLEAAAPLMQPRMGGPGQGGWVVNSCRGEPAYVPESSDPRPSALTMSRHDPQAVFGLWSGSLYRLYLAAQLFTGDPLQLGRQGFLEELRIQVCLKGQVGRRIGRQEDRCVSEDR